jgi:hypothetical protein
VRHALPPLLDGPKDEPPRRSPGQHVLKIYTLEPADDRNDAWLFFADDAQGRLKIRPEYADLACRRCGKFDEDAAIARGLPVDFVIRSKRDYIATCDDHICVSPRFRDHALTANLSGLRFIPLPRGDRYLAICDRRMPTDESKAGFENHDLCVVCRRYRERLVGPALASMQLPETDAGFFVSEIANENIKVAYRPIFAGERVKQTLKAAKLTGIDFTEAW